MSLGSNLAVSPKLGGKHCSPGTPARGLRQLGLVCVLMMLLVCRGELKAKPHSLVTTLLEARGAPRSFSGAQGPVLGAPSWGGVTAMLSEVHPLALLH